MKERPILFSTQMVQAILAGRKTQTRREVKGLPTTDIIRMGLHPNGTQYLTGQTCPWKIECPYGEIGDRLWVREKFGWYNSIKQGSYAYQHGEIPTYPPHKLLNGVKHAVCYFADYPKHRWDPKESGWKSSIHMPRTASRITLEITRIRVQLLNKISAEDCEQEGMDAHCDNGKHDTGDALYYEYKKLWESIHGKGSWELNPWVWVIEFSVLKG